MYTLTFTEQQMHLLNTAIGEMPHKHAAPFIQSINEQIMRAQTEEAAAKEDAKSDSKPNLVG